MKNFIKEGQKLPLFGIGPFMIGGMVALTIVGIFLSFAVLKSGWLSGIWSWISIGVGAVLWIAGFVVWFISAKRSGMDENISENILKTDGIYAWVRNPMYSGIWLMITGGTLMFHNAWLFIIPFVNWLIMTIVLINTEEKWLLDLYGEEYAEYKKHVNRCIPWIPRKK